MMKKIIITLLSSALIILIVIGIFSLFKNRNNSEITAPTANTLTYNSSEQELITVGSVNGGSLVYALGNENKATSEYKESIPTAEDAGTYYIWYKEANTKKAKEYKVQVKIEKQKVDEPTLTNSNFDYTGDEHTVIINGEESYMIRSTDSVLKATEKGTYTIAYTLNDNYCWNEGYDGILTWNIGKSQASITVDQTPIVIAYGESFTLPTATSNFGTVTKDKVEADIVNVGNYVVTYTVEGTNSYNGDSKTVSVKITKGQANITVDTSKITKEYGESFTLPTATSNFGTVTKDKVEADIVNVGNYVVTYSIEGTDNYCGDNKTISVEITKISQTAPSAPTLYSKTSTKVTLNSISSQSQVKYAYNTTNSAPESDWSNYPSFKDLTPNTTYYFFAKLIGSGNTSDSPASTSLSVTTNNAYTVTPTLVNAKPYQQGVYNEQYIDVGSNDKYYIYFEGEDIYTVFPTIESGEDINLVNATFVEWQIMSDATSETPASAWLALNNATGNVTFKIACTKSVSIQVDCENCEPSDNFNPFEYDPSTTTSVTFNYTADSGYQFNTPSDLYVYQNGTNAGSFDITGYTLSNNGKNLKLVISNIKPDTTIRGISFNVSAYPSFD